MMVRASIAQVIQTCVHDERRQSHRYNGPRVIAATNAILRISANIEETKTGATRCMRNESATHRGSRRKQKTPAAHRAHRGFQTVSATSNSGKPFATRRTYMFSIST
jgi:hypothetical protein